MFLSLNMSSLVVILNTILLVSHIIWRSQRIFNFKVFLDEDDSNSSPQPGCSKRHKITMRAIALGFTPIDEKNLGEQFGWFVREFFLVSLVHLDPFWQMNNNRWRHRLDNPAFKIICIIFMIPLYYDPKWKSHVSKIFINVITFCYSKHLLWYQ